MLIVQNTIISDDIVDSCFACDLTCCKGQCCVEGDCGAPLDKDEIPVLEQILPAVLPYMTAAGRDVVEKTGVWTYDNVWEPCTPLVNKRECAFVAWGEDGTAYCAIEQAYRNGETNFCKPVSCHLYPIRVDQYDEFAAVNYHRWDVCRNASQCGAASGVPLYRYLREPLIRKFGRQWYDELLAQCQKQQSMSSNEA
ncbi:MAG: hypothetical protein AUK63_183 [bacterium P3]|nr:MAG: hypothetical protein AUK63_183 [bacterium P3]KWW42355.1 MAG: hypothetical protein F083_259 [bacterium F083]